MDNLTRSYNYAYEQLHYADFTVLLNPTPQKIIYELRKIDNVENIEGRITVNIGIYINKNRQIAGLAVGINSTHRPTVNDVKVESGRFFISNETNMCLLEHHFATAYGYKEGDNVTLIVHGVRVNFTVVGVVASPEYLIVMSGLWEISSGYTYGVVFLPLAKLQNMLNMSSMINEIVVTVKDESKINTTITRFKEILNPYGIIKMVKKTEQLSYKALQWDLKGFGEVSVLFSALILFVAVVETYMTLKRLILSQQKEIGILKTMGFSKKRIVFHYLSFALLVGVLGSIFGTFLSIFCPKK